MDSVYLNFLQSLSQKKARYLVAGGVAVNLYGCERMTRDIDIILDLDDLPTMNVFFEVCRELDLKPCLPVRIEDFGKKPIREQWINEKHMIVFCLTLHNNPFIKIDIFCKKPENFDKMYHNKKIIRIPDGDKSFEVTIVSLHDLIKMKEDAGREKDLIDINNLKRGFDYEKEKGVP